MAPLRGALDVAFDDDGNQNLRGVGITPRFFEALVNEPDGTLLAQSSAYVRTTGQHVQSVAPSKQVMAQYWVPIVIEGRRGARRVLHVDPLAVRKFRRSIAGELQHVQDKRRRMLARIEKIRQEFPEVCAHQVASRLRREIEDAQLHIDEPLFQALPTSTRSLHILIEVTPHMVQLGLVLDRLASELPTVVSSTFTRHVSCAVLKSGTQQATPEPELFDLGVPPDLRKVIAWFRSIDRNADETYRKGRKVKTKNPPFRLAKALRRCVTADLQNGEMDPSAVAGQSQVLVLACSRPCDVQESVDVVRRSGMVLQVVGIFGASPEDPEPALHELVSAAAPTSAFRLFFGPVYWQRFMAARQAQLEKLQRERLDDLDASAVILGDEREVVSDRKSVV